jgi:flagellar biosynthesis/type III secretory pathway protein FliH
MTLSSTPEFVPWVIQPVKDRIFSEADNLIKLTSGEGKEEWTPKNVDAEVAPQQPGSMDSDSVDSDQATGTEITDDLEVVEEEQVTDPELVPTFSPIDYKEHGEAEYLRGYNACKENEKLEFGDRLEQLTGLIDTLRNEYVDLNEFYDPLRELVVSAIESIMQTELVESKKSISSIVSTILEEISSVEADGSIRLFLNPNDAVLLKNQKSPNDTPIKILSDPRLSVGSARAVMGDSVIENMKENRVSHIVGQILVDKKAKTTRSSRKK